MPAAHPADPAVAVAVVIPAVFAPALPISAAAPAPRLIPAVAAATLFKLPIIIAPPPLAAAARLAALVPVPLAAAVVAPVAVETPSLAEVIEAIRVTDDGEGATHEQLLRAIKVFEVVTADTLDRAYDAMEAMDA